MNFASVVYMCRLLDFMVNSRVMARRGEYDVEQFSLGGTSYGPCSCLCEPGAASCSHNRLDVLRILLLKSQSYPLQCRSSGIAETSIISGVVIGRRPLENREQSVKSYRCRVGSK